MSGVDNETKIAILEFRNQRLEDELDRCRKLLSESEQREAHAPAPQQPDAVDTLLKACEPFEIAEKLMNIKAVPDTSAIWVRGNNQGEDTQITIANVRRLANAASAVRAAGNEGGG